MSGRGQISDNASTASKPSNQSMPKKKKKDEKKNFDSSSDLDISYDKCKCSHSCKCFEELKSEFEHKFKLWKIEVDAKISTLHSVIEKKDESNGKLHKEIGELKTTCSYLTEELKNVCKKVDCHENFSSKKFEMIDEKAADLEDRSRRNNLVFFGIPESDGKSPENCEEVISDILIKQNIMTHQNATDPSTRELFDRAHRLGPKKSDQDQPRPIIVKATYFKDKQYILSNSYKMKNSPYNVSEDFSKPTLAIRRTLVSRAKLAKTQCPEVKSFKLKYKNLVIQYECNGRNGKYNFYKSFSLKDVQDPKWFLPREREPNHQTKITSSQGYVSPYENGRSSKN